MGFMSRVSIALSLIAVAVNGFHVESVEAITATCHFSFEHAWKAKD